MKPRILTRAVLGTAATVAMAVPLAACSGDGGASGSATESATAPPDNSAPEFAGTSPSSSTVAYADGIYTARGVYGGAPSYMDFTVTLEGGVITDVTSELMPDNNDTSRGYQERFAAAVPDEVEGKSIDGLELGVIAGASGCADGFNDALDKIRGEASVNN